MKRPKTGGNAAVLIKGVLIGLGVGLAVLAACCVLAAVLIGAGKLPESAMRYCAWIACALSAAAGCLTAQALAGRAHLIVSLGCGLLLTALLLAVHAITAGGGTMGWHCPVIVCAAALAAALWSAGRGLRRR